MKSESPQHKLRKERVRQQNVSPVDILAFCCVGMMALISCFMMGFLLGLLFMT